MEGGRQAGDGRGHGKNAEAGQRGGSGDYGVFSDDKSWSIVMEAGLRPAAAQLENRQRQFAAHALGVPRGG
jgi:hypothetical protein